MIELTKLNGKKFILNCELIESIVSIPDTKITLTTDNYILVKDSKEEVVNKVIAYKKAINGVEE